MKPRVGLFVTCLVIGDDERFTALTWPNTVAYEHWQPDDTLGGGTAALTHAWGAVAETGTLVMTSSAASPASLAFLPELHIVALTRGISTPPSRTQRKRRARPRHLTVILYGNPDSDVPAQ